MPNLSVRVVSAAAGPAACGPGGLGHKISVLRSHGRLARSSVLGSSVFTYLLAFNTAHSSQTPTERGGRVARSGSDTQVSGKSVT